MAEDMETLADEVVLQRDAMEHEPGTAIPKFLIDAQVELGQLSAPALARHFANVVVAVALRHPSSTPRKQLAKFLEGYRLSDEAWHGHVRNDLVKALTARGVTLDTLKEDGDDAPEGG